MNHTKKVLYDEAVSFMQNIFPNQKETLGTISKEEQEKILQLFDSIVNYHTFYVVVDVAEQRISHSNGIAQHLLYKNTFDLYEYFEAIPEEILKMLNQIAMAAFDVAHGDKDIPKFMDNSLTIDQPMQRADGKYILTQKTIYAFDICPDGKVKSHLNLYVVLREIDFNNLNFALEPRVKSKEKLRVSYLEDKLNQGLQERFLLEKKMYLTRAEKEVMVEIKKNLKNREIAEQLGIAENTIKTLKSRAIKRCNLYFGLNPKLKTADELVKFIEKNKLNIL